MIANRARGLIAATAAVTTLYLCPMLAPAAKAQEAPAAAAETENDAARLIAAKGAWSPTRNYVVDDLVTSRGSTWRARRANINKVPGSTLPSTGADWQLFARGFNPAGHWLASKTYHSNDLIAHQGATWRAKRTGSNKPPHSSPTDWQRFAAKGAEGEKGDKGDKGDQGDKGDKGDKGDTGDAGPQGIPGTSGTNGTNGTNGSDGATGPQGLPGPNTVADGLVGAPAINFASSPSTGIYSPSTGKIALAASGAPFLHNIGTDNTALGVGALTSVDFASGNTALGTGALTDNVSGLANTAVGSRALGNSVGLFNTAVGYDALGNNITGNSNIALGVGAGFSADNPGESIFIGNSGLEADSHTIKIGKQGIQTSAFIAGISGINVTGAAVLVSASGQLGVNSSSRRYKEEIQPMADASAALRKLRPVTFRYKQPYEDGSKPLEYGLIAEEVAETFPDLAVFNAKGQPETVKYHLLPSLLLNEVQGQQKTIQSQAERIAALEQRLISLEARLSGPGTLAASPRAASLTGVEP